MGVDEKASPEYGRGTMAAQVEERVVVVFGDRCLVVVERETDSWEVEEWELLGRHFVNEKDLVKRLMSETLQMQ